MKDGYTLIRKAREDSRLSQARLARLTNTSPQQIERLENGKRKLTRAWAERIGPHIGVSPTRLIFGENRTVNVVGISAEGSDAIDFEQAPSTAVEPPEWANEKTVAIEIREGSLGPIFDGGWLAFYDDNRDPPTADLIGYMCIIGLTSGKVVLKRLERGQLPDRFNLRSNIEPPIYDAEVKWAAKVKTLEPTA